MCNYFYIGTQICADLISDAVLFETFIGGWLGATSGGSWSDESKAVGLR